MFVIILGLLFYGTGFSKFVILGNIHLFDLTLVTLSFIILIRFYKRLVYKPLIMFSVISILYLILSFIKTNISTTIILRQFALFGYFILFYLIFTSISYGKSNLNYIKFIVLVGKLSMLIQIFYLILLTIQGKNVFSNYYYFTPLIVMGIIVFFSYILVEKLSLLKKILLFVLVMIISLTMGHASAYMSLLVILFVHMNIIAKSVFKLLPVIVFICSVIYLMAFNKDYNDANSSWRMTLWVFSFENIIKNNYAILGEGFGIPYFNDNVLTFAFKGIDMNELFQYSFLDEQSKYLSPVHNSFITIAQHIGLIPMLLIFYPFYRLLKYRVVVFSNKNENKATLFLMYSLIGLTIWSSFNVILELPHSSIFYWFVYFALLKEVDDRLTDYKTKLFDKE